MQALLENVRIAVDNEPGKTQLKGYNKEQVVASVQAVTEALDKLPPSTSLHVVLFAVTYVRNALLAAMEENNKVLATQTGGQG